MTELCKLTIAEALDKLNNKEVSSKELTQAHLDQINKHQNLNAFITLLEEEALSEAEQADKNRAEGKARPLEGIPVGLKDIFCTKNIKTTAGSKMLANFVPSYESTVGGKLRQNGGVLLGKLNMDEFAMGSANTNSYFGNVVNPWKKNSSDEELIPGGSSGGSSASVAAYMSMATLGTDTGGSVRQPASLTGTVGFKPTYGRCSRWGMIAFASSLDQAGCFTRSVEDAGLILEQIMGHDPKDSTSAQKEVPKLTTSLNDGVKGAKVGVPYDLMQQNFSQEVKQNWEQSIEKLKSEGAEIVDITLPHAEYALPIYYVIAPAEASSNLARYDGVRYGYRYEEENITLNDMYELTRAYGFGEEVKRRIMIGTFVLSSGFYNAYYLKARKIRRLIANDFANAFSSVDTILIPSSPSAAFEINTPQDNPVDMYANDLFTAPVSLAGLPSVSVPSGKNSDGLPLGMQFVGNAFEEEKLLRVARGLERVVDDKFIPGGFE